MKALTAVMVALLCLAQIATAQTVQDICEATGTMAEAVMKSRQSGILMSDVMKDVNKYFGGEELEGIVRQMVIEAFKIPRVSGIDAQADIVLSFRNKIELTCYQNMNQ